MEEEKVVVEETIEETDVFDLGVDMPDDEEIIDGKEGEENGTNN